ncbi:hypothetical protein [uncultured Mucilaginibacter sp.]|uniref:hypothetical protein n=1 Tax=uncultured Mucilaginibacter sp. TaxID=797541 RepID=UPI002603D359|nr:hypothetical protein [uncultured Mucilaginibacter sp.]
MKFTVLSPTDRSLKLNYGQLDDTLKKLNYTAAKALGGHVVYKHPKNISLLAVRHFRKTEIVPKAVLASIVRNIINTNVANETEIKKAIAEVQQCQA